MEQWTTPTGGRLIDAAYSLANTKPIDRVSVAELCRTAGITRDTFYRYAARPIDVLAAGMEADLARLDLSTGSPAEGASPMDRPTRAILDHVRRNQLAYRQALRPHLDSALRDVLITRIEALLVEHLALYPTATPDILGGRPTEQETRMLVAYAASGAVGTIERWLAEGDLDDVERASAILYAVSAPWWILPPTPPRA